MKHSFFESFTPEQIFSLWNSSNTLLEIAQKLGFSGSELQKIDYEYILKIKTRDVWKKNVLGNNRQGEKGKHKFLNTLSEQELLSIMNSEGIQTLGHLGIHFLLSQKHGRKVLREKIIDSNLPVKKSLHKGVYGVSANPIHYPKKFYEKRVQKKPMVCDFCRFQAVNSKQIELHHADENLEKDTKGNRTSGYYRTQNIIPLCANCHSLEHRTGERLFSICGKWKNIIPLNVKYSNPHKIFSENCEENYRMQKKYYLKCILSGPDDFRCAHCGTQRWGFEQKLLSLELHHKDRNHRNSSLSNLELLCPNCHRAQ